MLERAGDVENALALWTEIQDDNVQPTNEFLITLVDLLQRNNRPVPFAIPARDETSSKSKNFHSKSYVPVLTSLIECELEA